MIARLCGRVISDSKERVMVANGDDDEGEEKIERSNQTRYEAPSSHPMRVKIAAPSRDFSSLPASFSSLLTVCFSQLAPTTRALLPPPPAVVPPLPPTSMLHLHQRRSSLQRQLGRNSSRPPGSYSLPFLPSPDLKAGTAPKCSCLCSCSASSSSPPSSSNEL